MFRHGRTVVIVRREPGGYDRYGDPVEGDETRIHVPGCAWSPRTQGAGPSAGEIEDRGRQGVIEGLTVFMPYGIDVRPHDELELDGKRFEVRGDPGEWWNPITGREAGIEVSVRRVEG